MGTWSKIAAASLLASPIGLLGNPSAIAQVPGDAFAALPDTLCDYCKDFTDKATAAGPVRSTYRPGAGYASEPRGESTLVRPAERQELGLEIVEGALGATPKRPD
jgi:hypothetical protein